MLLAAPPWLQRDWDRGVSPKTLNSRLAAPPWLQRDWDIAFDNSLSAKSCSTSLTSKGLRPKAIKQFKACASCSTSLTSKGLRPSSPWPCLHRPLAAPPWLQRDWDVLKTTVHPIFVLAAPPWLQRDWDSAPLRLVNFSSLQHLPDFKGIETY